MGVTITIVTFGQNLHREGWEPHSRSAPTITHVDCIDLQSPPRDICRLHTGLSSRVRRDVFSYRAANSLYKDSLEEIDDYLRSNRERSHPKDRLTVLVSCKAGVHRSVPMAERLAREVEKWRHVTKVKIDHLELDDALERREGR